MEEHLYDELAEVDDRHWWCVGRRHIVRTVLAGTLGAAPAAGRDILDVGGGTGGMLGMLTEFGRVQGLDMSAAAVSYCNQRLGDRVDVRVGDIPDAVPAEPSVDLVTAF